MKKVLVGIICIGALSLFANTPPEITNVRASQRADTKLVDIYYDAADADGDLLKVRVEISDNDGVRYSVPAFSLTGDIGEGIAPGTGKHIVWDAGTDWDGEYSDQMRVKVFAIDAKGFPGMEWGNEVPPGGFLMGQDGGAEGSGPSRHVNIPWPYWMGKYEVTCQQYCDFLNAALNLKYIERVDTTNVCATANMPIECACRKGVMLCTTGDNRHIRWNVNKFECTNEEKKNLPVNVTWYGAMAFARFYGYDLPTDAEWEKAARGKTHDDAGEHLCYPWGDGISTSYANTTPGTEIMPTGYYNGNQVPIGPDTISEYGLYDIIGNAPEWTLSCDNDIELYPQEELLTSTIHNPYRSITRTVGTSSYISTTVVDGADRIIRGLGLNAIHWRNPSQVGVDFPVLFEGYVYSGTSYGVAKIPQYTTIKAPMGFRVVRRQDRQFIGAEIHSTIDFENWQGASSYNSAITNETNGLKWVFSGGVSVTDSGVDDSKCVKIPNSSECRFYLPQLQRRLVLVRFKIKGVSAGNPWYVYLAGKSIDGLSKTNTFTVNESNGNIASIHDVEIPMPIDDAVEYYIYVGNGSAYIDDMELVTLTE